MISIAALIYKSATFADATVKSLLEFTPHLHDGRARFFFVANDASPELLAHLDKKGYAYVRQDNKDRSEQELLEMGYAGPAYIHRVYRGWNRAIIESEEQLVLLNSDMQFSPGWLEGLEQFWNPNLVLTSTLVERWQDKFGDKHAPGHANYFVERDFGDHPLRFDASGFYAFSKSIAKPEIKPGRHYASVMMSRSRAIEAGLYPEGNLFSPWGVYSGDRAFFARLKTKGVGHAESSASVVYHFNEGEMVDTENKQDQQLKFNSVISKIDTADADGLHAQENFSGLYSVSNQNICQTVSNYVMTRYKPKNHIDIGGSIGRLSNVLLNNGIDSYSLDGTDYGWNNNLLLIPRDRYAVIDFTKPTEFNTKFDLATCFEVLEHVPQQHLNVFFDNVKKAARQAFISIHVGGELTDNHVTLKPKGWWLEFLSAYGHVTESLFKIPNEFENSIFLEIEFN